MFAFTARRLLFIAAILAISPWLAWRIARDRSGLARAGLWAVITGREGR